MLASFVLLMPACLLQTTEGKLYTTLRVFILALAHCVFSFHSEQISKRQSQIDRLYVSLKDLVEERKSRLEQQYWLYQLNREVDELEQWIAQKEVVASSPELGQDFEHVTVSVSADGVCG